MNANIKYHFYHTLAKFYDDFYKGKNYKAEAEFFYDIFKRFENLRTRNVLDVGCGTASHLKILSGYFENVYGIDPSKPMLEIAKNKCGNTYHFFAVRIQDFIHTPIFDLVVSYNSALNYLSGYAELCLTLKRIFAVLSDSGVIVIQLHDCIDKDYLISRVAYHKDDKLIVVGDWLQKNKYGSHSIDFFYHLYSNSNWSSYHDIHKECFFTEKEIRNALKQAGFSNIQILKTSKEDDSPFKSSEYICSAQKGQGKNLELSPV